MTKKDEINRGLILMDQDAVKEMLPLSDVIHAVEQAYAEYSNGDVNLPPIVSMELPDRDAELDVKTGYMAACNIIAVKVASGFYRNEKEYNIPSWPSLVTLLDGDTGFPCAVMDGGYITTARTGAAGAVAAKYLARKNSSKVLIVGAGNQARIQLQALLKVMPKLTKAYIYSPIKKEVQDYVTEMSPVCNMILEGITEEIDLKNAAEQADIIVTVTPSKKPLIRKEWIKPGTHINAIGSDGPGKQELDTAILENAKVIADAIKQVVQFGECQHGVNQGIFKKSGEGIYAEIGEIVCGLKKGRETDEEITVFDATGIAALDVATANLAYQRQKESKVQERFKMFHV